MGLVNAAKNLMLDELATVAVFASLHSADPGTTGANEITGGTPAYARKAVTWSAASGGAVNQSNAPVFDVPAGASVQYIGYWSAVTGGTFYGSDQVTTESFGEQGTYTLEDTNIDLNAV